MVKHILFTRLQNGDVYSRFDEQDVRPTGRSSMGVIGMSLVGEDQIIECS